MIRDFNIPLQSSALTRMSYRSETQTLTVTFKGGHTYEYTGISLAVARAFMQSESKGKFYNRVLRGLASREVLV